MMRSPPPQYAKSVSVFGNMCATTCHKINAKCGSTNVYG